MFVTLLLLQLCCAAAAATSAASAAAVSPMNHGFDFRLLAVIASTTIAENGVIVEWKPDSMYHQCTKRSKPGPMTPDT